MGQINRFLQDLTFKYDDWQIFKSVAFKEGSLTEHQPINTQKVSLIFADLELLDVILRDFIFCYIFRFYLFIFIYCLCCWFLNNFLNENIFFGNHTWKFSLFYILGYQKKMCLHFFFFFLWGSLNFYGEMQFLNLLAMIFFNKYRSKWTYKYIKVNIYWNMQIFLILFNLIYSEPL